MKSFKQEQSQISNNKIIEKESLLPESLHYNNKNKYHINVSLSKNVLKIIISEKYNQKKRQKQKKQKRTNQQSLTKIQKKISNHSHIYKSQFTYQKLDDIKVKPYFDDIQQLYTFIKQHINNQQIIQIHQSLLRIHFPIHKKVRIIDLQINQTAQLQYQYDGYIQKKSFSQNSVDSQIKQELFRLQDLIKLQKDQIIHFINGQFQKYQNKNKQKDLKLQGKLIKLQKEIEQSIFTQIQTFKNEVKNNLIGEEFIVINQVIQSYQQKNSQAIDKLKLQLTKINQEIQFMKEHRAAPDDNPSNSRYQRRQFDITRRQQSQRTDQDDHYIQAQLQDHQLVQVLINADSKIQSFAHNYIIDSGQKIIKTCKGFTMLISQEALPKQGKYFFTINCLQLNDNYIAVGILTQSDKGKPFSIYSNQTICYHGKDKRVWYNNSRTQGGQHIQSYDQIRVMVNLMEKQIIWQFGDKDQATFTLPNHFLEQSLYAALALYHEGDSITLN